MDIIVVDFDSDNDAWYGREGWCAAWYSTEGWRLIIF